ncbi:MAG: c-type cytochrome [Terriglobales bacterium]|jgi:mono/diheme cytochrome c family protein
MKSVTTVILLALLAFPCALAGSQGNATAGKAVFMDQCSICHGADASGRTPVAKSLGATIPDYRSKQVQSLTDPDIRRVITEGKGNMPPVGNLSEGDVTNLIAFIRSFPIEQTEESIEQGSPQRGEQLFTGKVHFRNGGPPCSTCHRVSDLPFPSGGTLGPDLTRTYSKLGSEGLDTALHTLFFPAMAPLYDPHLLTVSEQADLKAFFEEANSRPTTNDLTPVAAAITLIGFAVLIFITWAVGRKRLQGVRRTLVETATSRRSVRQ